MGRSMILVLYSPDPQMARHVAMKAIRKDFPVRDEFNYVSFNMTMTTLNDLADECSYLPLGTERKCVVASDCAFLAKTKAKFKPQKGDGTERLLRYLEHPDEAVDLYMLVYAENVDEKNPLLLAAEKNGTVKGVPLPKPEEWVTYATKYCAAKGSDIDPDAARELVTRVDNDYGRFLCDLEKLVTYANGERITLATVKELVTPKIEEDTFAMSNALSRGDVSKAIAIYQDLKSHSIEEIRLINTLASQFTFMHMVRYLDAKGMSSYDIARELGTSPKRVEVTARNLYRVKGDSLSRILDELYETEKAILTGTVQPEFAFSRFLANFSL